MFRAIGREAPLLPTPLAPALTREEVEEVVLVAEGSTAYMLDTATTDGHASPPTEELRRGGATSRRPRLVEGVPLTEVARPPTLMDGGVPSRVRLPPLVRQEVLMRRGREVDVRPRRAPLRMETVGRRP